MKRFTSIACPLVLIFTSGLQAQGQYYPSPYQPRLRFVAIPDVTDDAGGGGHPVGSPRAPHKADDPPLPLDPEKGFDASLELVIDEAKSIVPGETHTEPSVARNTIYSNGTNHPCKMYPDTLHIGCDLLATSTLQSATSLFETTAAYLSGMFPQAAMKKGSSEKTNPPRVQVLQWTAVDGAGIQIELQVQYWPDRPQPYGVGIIVRQH
jgi:hypothetical protein